MRLLGTGDSSSVLSGKKKTSFLMFSTMLLVSLRQKILSLMRSKSASGVSRPVRKRESNQSNLTYLALMFLSS